MLPEEARRWQLVETAVRSVLCGYGYEEVGLPLLETTALFARGVGEATDIVEKEMYTLDDRGGDSLSLRPEGTAGCVRALQEHGLLYNQTQRVFYAGPMFRYERPQRGRYRQFTQIGAETFGLPGPDVDVELIAMLAECWEVLELTGHVRLELNTLGTGPARRAYRDALVKYLEPHAQALDEDSRRRLTTNPLRILDSKVETTQALLAQAPDMHSFVDDESHAHFASLCASLDSLGIAYTVNPRLVRGLDYYTRTVFEWITDDLGAQGTVCGGGRYDGLVAQLGGRDTPGAGFGLGVDRVALLHEVVHQARVPGAVDAYICFTADEALPRALAVNKRLRTARDDFKVRVNLGGGSFKKQLKRADACGAAWAVLIGDDELRDGTLTVKNLRDGTQSTAPEAAALAALGAAP